MIVFTTKNIFDCETEILVNPVNTVGVMGKGLALDFKNKYPSIMQPYVSACQNGTFGIGKLLLINVENNKKILLFPTKENWLNNSKVEYIEAGLKKIKESYVSKKMYEISFPKIGCGLGGLDFKKQILPLFLKYFYNETISIMIHIQKDDLKNMKDVNICDNCKCFFEPVSYIENNQRYIDYFQCPICGKKETTSGEILYKDAINFMLE